MLFSGKLADANYQRIKYVTTSTTVTDAVACDDNANTEFHLLVKNGNSNKLFSNNLCYLHIIRLPC